MLKFERLINRVGLQEAFHYATNCEARRKISEKTMKKSTYSTNSARQARRVAELQAAALRDGFASWSTALTAWKRGDVVMVPAPKRKRAKKEQD